jgi:hypothetical protein
MVGALLVLGGMTLFLARGVQVLIEETIPVSSLIETRTPEGMNPVLPIGAALTFAGGIVLLLSSPRRVS